MKKELEEEYAAALAANEAKMAEMQRNFEDMLKEEEEGNSVSCQANESITPTWIYDDIMVFSMDNIMRFHIVLGLVQF